MVGRDMLRIEVREAREKVGNESSNEVWIGEEEWVVSYSVKV